ncbi:Nn.00g018400.m01.CDS01 [Neocucurbitaria sp. VM-36]
MTDQLQDTIGFKALLQISHPLPTTMLSESLIHIFTTVLTLLLSIITAFYIHHDYRAFLSLGPGGTPSTPLGYLKIKLLSLICLRDPLRPLPIPPHFRPQTGYLHDSALPKRKGTKPIVQGIAPQRQQTQKSDGHVYARLVTKIKQVACDPRNQLMERTSCFEKHSSGLFTSIPITRTCGGEICHAHPSDGSMHMTLHPADAKVVLENGWGERHPLARGGWCRRFVPREFVLIYAPRDEKEVEIMMRIVAASVWWVSGVDVNGDESGPRRRSADVAAVSKAMEGNECWACKAHGWGGGKVEKMTGDA